MSNGSSVLQSGLPSFRHPHPAHFYRDLPLVRIGLPITLAIDALPGQTFSGTMHTIDLVADPARRHVRMGARIANPKGKRKPGLFVRATADPGRKARAATPVSALQPQK
ncbi:MAG: hypothetical protein B7Z03_01495 [Hydrogenophilales bacterium 32-62-9]|nr:MAG: hypothetical protein B7Z03_01495 [Hydrogenophilales bacterium 32-62-9]